MSVAVVSQDEILLQKGFGSTAAENGHPVDEHTLFAIASTTKAMVVTGVLMLVDEGKLSLDDPIIKHIPELHFADPALTQQLIVRDLLAHRTGLPSTDFWSFMQGMSLDEQIVKLQKVPSIAPARTRLIYQNTMYEIAGLLIERLSGQLWHDFLTERLWQPIGMQETYGARGQISAQQSHVTPHLYIDDKLSVPPWNFAVDYADAAGSVWSSIHDMSLWAQFLLRDFVTEDGDRLVSGESIKQMFEPHQLASVDDFYPTVELTKPNWRTYGLA
jgi:CubicO group peptidase (beta-lactamase class C family)